MKLDFKLPDDGAIHLFCIVCHADGAERIKKNGRTVFHCPSCGATEPRMIYNGATKHWTAPDGTWWHESVGIFVRNPQGKFLFFELTNFPFGTTVPAGHVDKGEEPLTAAKRELSEEVDIQADDLEHIASADIPGDSCSGGCDDHRWNIFLKPNYSGGQIKVLEEGKNPIWLTLDEALAKKLPVPIRFLIEKYQNKLQV